MPTDYCKPRSPSHLSVGYQACLMLSSFNLALALNSKLTCRRFFSTMSRVDRMGYLDVDSIYCELSEKDIEQDFRIHCRLIHPFSLLNLLYLGIFWHCAKLRKALKLRARRSSLAASCPFSSLSVLSKRYIKMPSRDCKFVNVG